MIKRLPVGIYWHAKHVRDLGCPRFIAFVIATRLWRFSQRWTAPESFQSFFYGLQNDLGIYGWPTRRSRQRMTPPQKAQQIREGT